MVLVLSRRSKIATEVVVLDVVAEDEVGGAAPGPTQTRACSTEAKPTSVPPSGGILPCFIPQGSDPLVTNSDR